MTYYYNTLLGIGCGMGWGLSAGLLLLNLFSARWPNAAILAGCVILCSIGIVKVAQIASRRERE